MVTRWLFGDQLGPHFLDDTDDDVLLIESTAVLRRRPFHRQKAHLVLSAMRHRAAELGERGTYLRSETYRSGLAEVDRSAGGHPADLMGGAAPGRPVGRRSATSTGCPRAASVPAGPSSPPGPTGGAGDGC